MKRRGWGEAGAFNLGCLNDRSRIRRIGGYDTSAMDKLVRGIRGGLDSLSRAAQMSDTAQIIADLARAKATFQLRAIKAAMGWPYAIRDSDRSGEAGETPQSGSTEGESAVPEGQSPK